MMDNYISLYVTVSLENKTNSKPVLLLHVHIYIQIYTVLFNYIIYSFNIIHLPIHKHLGLTFLRTHSNSYGPITFIYTI